MVLEAKGKEATWHASQFSWIGSRAVFQKPWRRGVWMLVNWQTLYSEDEKMEAWVGPLLLDLLGVLTVETRTFLLKRYGCGKQNPYICPHHFFYP